MMTVGPSTTLLDLKNVVGGSTGLANKDMVLSINGSIGTSPRDLMSSYKLKPRNLIHILPAFHSAPSRHIADYSPLSAATVSSYSPYIRDTFPVDGRMEVSVSAAISVHFQSVPHVSRATGLYCKVLARHVGGASATGRSCRSLSGDSDESGPRVYNRRLFLDCFKDSSCRVGPGSFRPLRSQDMTAVLGGSQAAKRGYVGWVREVGECTMGRAPQQQLPNWTSRRMFLLEVRSDLPGRWREMSYHFGLCEGVNGSYCGGDKDSWQRYTHRLPVRGIIHVDNATNSLTFKPSQHLKEGTTYGVLLSNGVPSVPEAGCQSTEDDWHSIQQDYMFFFTTAGTRRSDSVDDDLAVSHLSHAGGISAHKTRVSSMANENLSSEEDPEAGAEACRIS